MGLLGVSMTANKRRHLEVLKTISEEETMFLVIDFAASNSNQQRGANRRFKVSRVPTNTLLVGRFNRPVSGEDHPKRPIPLW